MAKEMLIKCDGTIEEITSALKMGVMLQSIEKTEDGFRAVWQPKPFDMEKRIPEEVVERICKEYSDYKLPISLIAKNNEVSESSVYSILKKKELYVTKESRDKEIIEMYRNGISTMEIARKYNISRKTVYAVIKEKKA